MSGSPSRGLRVVAVIAMAVVLAATGTPVMTQTFAAPADAPAGSVAGTQRAEGREKASSPARGAVPPQRAPDARHGPG
jgi:hypothetical protein